MKCFYDFHIHSCLSPCGDRNMTPHDLVNMAKLLGLDVIALTDHNTCLNCPAAVKVGQSADIAVVPGMELCTCEEVHVICLFPDIAASGAFSEHILSTLPKVVNRPDIFGEQLIMDEQDNVICEHELLLATASTVSVSNVARLVREFGGACFPAHIDRTSYSVISNLGMLTPDMGFTAVELTENADIDEWRQRYPIIKNAGIFIDSDAHYLENMKEAKYTVELRERSAAAVVEYINSLELMK
ncbi:MAG: PHP domain-containing protein [Clostridia bacterium]|nr:PHP domain-containing protein [Clostridia bacterium]